MKTINSAIILRQEDTAGSALTTLLQSLACWSDTVSVVILAEETAPQALTLPVGLMNVIWFDQRHACDDLACMADSLLPALKDVSHLLFLEGKAIRPLAARIAAIHDCDMITDITHILSSDSCQRPVFAGQALLTVQSLTEHHVWTLRRQAFEGTGGDMATMSYAVTDCPAVAGKVQKVSTVRHISENCRPRLSQAEIVVGGGRGVSKPQWPLLGELADKLGAALGGTRALVDAGFFTEQDQIGQTGEQISPRVYLACGISGAIQHVAGISNSNIIIAINSDPQAPIIKKYADHYLVGDLAEVLPLLLAKL